MPLLKRYQELKAALRKGMLPADLPGFKAIGEGTFRTAYSDGVFVVKPAVGHWNPFTSREVREYNRRRLENFPNHTPAAKHAICVTVGGWAIQLYYPPLVPHKDSRNYMAIMDVYRKLSKEEQAVIHTVRDDHAGNFGRDRRGRLVCFDW